MKETTADISTLIQDDLNFNKGTARGEEMLDYSIKAFGVGKGAFLDEDNFTGNLVAGVWYFQHYHTIATTADCNRKYIGDTFKMYESGKERFEDEEYKGGTFEVVAVNEQVATREELLEALRFEFTLPLPQDKRYELDKYILPVMEKLL